MGRGWLAGLLLLMACVHTPRELGNCRARLAKEQLPQAAQSCELAIAEDPSRAPVEAYVHRAEVALRQRSFEVGLGWVDAGLLRFPEHVELLELRVGFLQKLGNHDGAVQVARHVAALAPRRFLAQRLLCDHYSSRKFGGRQAPHVISACSAYLEHRPETLRARDGEYRVRLGFAYVAMGRHAEARHEFAVVLSHPPTRDTHDNARKGLCAAEVAIGEYDHGITTCQDVVQRRATLKGDPSPYYNLGLAYFARGRHEQALDSANEYIQRAPSKAMGFALRGRINFERRRHEDAEVDFSRASDKDPEDQDIAVSRATNLLQLQRFRQAIDMLQKFWIRETCDAELQEVLARAYRLDGRLADADAVDARQCP
jgi:tetratricopeptide (TPR) repeat protein